MQDLIDCKENAANAPEIPIRTLINTAGDPVMDKDKVNVTVDPDCTELHVVDGTVLMVSKFESPNPEVIYITTLEQNMEDGSLEPVATTPANWSSSPELGGLWIPCAGSITPWGTHAGGEEFEPDAYCIETATSLNGLEPTSLVNCMSDGAKAIILQMRNWGVAPEQVTVELIREYFNPYEYGHAFEVFALTPDGGASLTEHYAMGRHSYDLWYAMPDDRTVYVTDSGANTAFWNFVADRPGDMSSGTLYGAKFNQTSIVNGGSFDIEWIELGSASQQEIVDIVLGGIKFSDIFEVAAWGNTTLCCPEGFTSVSKRDNGMEAMCLKLKVGMEKAAAFLESRRYLAMLGGTVEFSKWQGLKFDPQTDMLYTAMPVLHYGMEDNAAKGENSTEWDEGGPNHVRLPYNPCGCKYRLDAEDYNVRSMVGIQCGVPHEMGNNTCDVNLPFEQDNIFLVAGGSLIIREDLAVT